jgi:3-phytase
VSRSSCSNRTIFSVSQNGAATVDYAHAFLASSNTGLASGPGLDDDGATAPAPSTPGYGGDALGFGNFAGQLGLALLSRFPIDQAGARRFQRFLWRDMPGALLPVSLATGEPWYAAEELAVLRLSAKAHVDVPIDIDGVVVHVLASHPTPPTFDDDEDRNGRRNHDEIRFWADYVRPGNGGYLVDDDGRAGGSARASGS